MEALIVKWVLVVGLFSWAGIRIISVNRPTNRNTENSKSKGSIIQFPR